MYDYVHCICIHCITVLILVLIFVEPPVNHFIVTLASSLLPFCYQIDTPLTYIAYAFTNMAAI